MAHSREASVSPMTRSPRSRSPAQTATDDAPVRRSGLQTELTPDDALKIANTLNQSAIAWNGKANVNSSEPGDYLNKGNLQDERSTSLMNGEHAPRAAQESSNLTADDQLPVPPTPVSNIAGSSTPPARKSVQFLRPDPAVDPTPYTRQDSLGLEDGEAPNKDRRGQSLMSKLRALASNTGLQTHGRSFSMGAPLDEGGTVSAPLSPAATRFPHTLQEEGSDVDADAEETGDESTTAGETRVKKKRRIRRPHLNGNRVGQPDSPAAGRTNFSLSRRVTDGSIDHRGHLSEGEGRDRLGNQSAWRRGSSWVSSGLAFGTSSNQQDIEADGTPTPRRTAFRRFTGLGGGGGGISDGDVQPPRRPFLGAERAATFGAQRWRMLKHGLKLLGQRKEEHRIDYMKSAELMAELRAGAPAALMLASMIQRDEHGNKRIPVLLEQLKLQITDSKPSLEDPNETERHLVFRIELEYGSGSNRMKWTINRSLRDFANLHIRYKLQASSDKYIQLRSDEARPKQPRFPKSAFPYFRGVRGLGDSDEEEAERVEETAGEMTHSENEGKKKKKRQAALGMPRRKSSIGGLDPGILAEQPGITQRRAYAEKQRKKLEQYLQEMIRWLIFRADSNRLCRFLELSALGVRLAAEGSYHGKEGYLVIQSAKGLDFRRILTPKNVFARHSPKWFLVRHSYIVCVDSPENMHIYDVYLVDSKFEIVHKRRKLTEMRTKDIVEKAETAATHPQHHTLKLQNSERKVKLLAKNERQLRQFEESITYMLEQTPWSKPNRFDSFAPVRHGVYAQWLVDGRDYMWNVSRAINMAKDVIYIHDWWLSPQLYMRRPAAISQKWRLDRLLQKKAREGVKIFIIIYRNVEAAIPIDSEYTKFSMLDLHPNVFVQRSPNQFKKNQFFFAHHEKICIVDHTVAFVGGIDLCFGRWDTPQHSVVDDKPTGFEESDLPKDADHCQLWPGKDYSNPRIQDFYKLSEPYAEMYDRTKVPRMPWHDISMQVVGQPARDLTRHFVQRWNYVLRGRKPTRPTPFLLPPPDYNPADLEALGLTGTCEVQILRSSTDWSMGLTETEHSIMTAYCKMIEESEHFVYMENQFFITSCETMGVKIVNKIGDAIVERAIRAHQNNEGWRCVILIPLMPGFQNTVDEPEGTSVRLIMQCQYRSICRGEGSIFGRLKSHGIEPEDFVQFYSLRSWGQIGPNKMLVTEQLYIHAKVIIVDDRIALIGSANINERSMLGSRDSECAAVVRDTDMIWSKMDGEPYLVGRFAHTLRMRLMREHLGLDVDEVMEEERRAELDREEEYQTEMNEIYNGPDGDDAGQATTAQTEQNEAILTTLIKNEETRSFNHDVDWEEAENPNLIPDKLIKSVTSDKRVTNNPKHAAEVAGDGPDRWAEAEKTGVVKGRDSVVTDKGREVLINGIATEGKGSLEQPRKSTMRPVTGSSHNSGSENKGSADAFSKSTLPRLATTHAGLSQHTRLSPLQSPVDLEASESPTHLNVPGTSNDSKPFNPLTADITMAEVDKDCMRDPLDDAFADDIWRRIAENNTKIFRRVFRCNPDSEVTNWHEYTEFVAYAERFAQAQGGAKSKEREMQEAPGKSGPPGALTHGPDIPGSSHGLGTISEKLKSRDGNHPKGTAAEWAENANAEAATTNDAAENTQAAANDEKTELREFSAGNAPPLQPNTDNGLAVDPDKANQRPSTRKTTFSTAPSEKVATMQPLNGQSVHSVKNRRRGGTRSSRKGFSGHDELLSREVAEELLSMVQGHLVLFPYDWLKQEEHNSHWLYQVDQVAPLQIYD
ncbi:phospholipase-like protein D1 [Xylogone sp. PMI_703]|nr:phospholipase-like protein D1 [Xylogone sp. PMI_703]